MKKWKLVQIENNSNIFFTSSEVIHIGIIDFHPVTNAPLQNQAYELIPNERELLVQYRDGFLELWEKIDED